ncbi:MAG: hypothetical protein KGH50_01610, partial [Candidatus Micrarchaeota archaeon]|nr:hypothetical protein [Candidatus Micrarchaeota archaeon]
ARLNGAARGGRKSRITDEQIRAAHSDKKTAAEMAKEFGIGRNQVYVRLRALRLKPNGRIRQGQGSALTHHDGRTAL